MSNKIKYVLAKIYWFIFRPKTFGVKCIVENNGEIVMIKNSYGNYKNWMFPGGGIDKNETAEEATKREVFEEVGLVVQNLIRIGEYTSAKEHKRDTVIVFVGQSINRNIKIDPNEISEAQWFKINNLSEISDYSKNIIAMWHQQK